MPMSGTAALIARVALLTRLSGLKASSHVDDFSSVGVYGKRAITVMPRFAASFAARTARSIVIRATPGIEGTGSETSFPSITNIGQIKSAGVKIFSRTKFRIQSVRRKRRGRIAGNCEKLCVIISPYRFLTPNCLKFDLTSRKKNS